MALDAQIKNQLQGYLTKLQNPIEIHTHLDESSGSKEMLELVQEISGLTDKIFLKSEDDSSQRKPSFSINRVGESTGVVFAGIPLGHEFNSLVLALLHVSGHPPKIDDKVKEQIQNLKGSFHFESYISLSCHNCPDVVQALNILSVLNPNIQHTMIDGALFQDEVNQKKILAVPAIFMNGQEFGHGRMGLDEILGKMDTETAAKKKEELSQKEPYDVLVVGGGPAGASAAIYAARKGIRTGVVTERFGGQVLETLSIQNFISVKSVQGAQLAYSLEEHVKEYGVDIITLQRAQSLVREKDFIEITLESGAVLKSKSIVLSTGARWRELGIPGEKEFKGKGVAYCPHCEGPVFKGKRVAVVGGGNSGVEAAIDLAGIVEHVTLLEFAPELKADGVLQASLKKLPNVDIITNAQTTGITGSDRVQGIYYTDRESLQKRAVDVAGVFVQIGLVPNTEWLKGSIELTPYGEIVVNSRGATSMTGVFAAGDCSNSPYNQIIIAMGDGAKASLSAFDYLIRNKG
jgi:alkyl hydroperoxide reductase subunit F